MPKKPISCSLDETILHNIDIYAATNNLNRSQVIEKALSSFLEILPTTETPRIARNSATFRLKQQEALKRWDHHCLLYGEEATITRHGPRYLCEERAVLWILERRTLEEFVPQELDFLKIQYPEFITDIEITKTALIKGYPHRIKETLAYLGGTPGEWEKELTNGSNRSGL